MLLRYPVLLLVLAAALALTACQAPSGSAGEPTPSPEPQPEATRIPEVSPTASPMPQPEATEMSEVAPTSTPQPELTPMPEAAPMPSSQASLAEGTGNADVEYVQAVQNADGVWTFSVTVRHPDTGWEDYADGWDVVLPDGTVVKPDPDSPFTRLLLHPHENEQPFTRSQSGIAIPDDIGQVQVRAHDLVDGWGGQEVVVLLTEASGPNFEVQRR